jgi:adenine-specific DNA-methyltransferase
LTKGRLPGAAASLLAAWDPYDQNKHASFFDPAWMFSLKDGFDVVIGNPPYVRQEQIRALKPRLKEHYDCFTGTADLYVYFYERSIQLLRPQGLLTFISSNSFLNSAFAKRLRVFLSSKTALRQIIDFGETGVFSAITEPSIILVAKGKPSESYVRLLRWREDERLSLLRERMLQRSFLVPQGQFGNEPWLIEDSTVRRLIERIKAAGVPLSEYVKGRFYRGILTGLNEAFVIDRATRDRLIVEHPSSAEVIKPFLRGRDVKRWQVEFGDQYLIKIASSENKRHPWRGRKPQEAEKIFAGSFPAIYRHFQAFKTKLIKRADQGHYYWELRSCNYWEQFDRPKIVYQDIARYYGMAWDDSGSLLVNTCYFIPGAEKWILACLLSKVTLFYVQKVLGSDEGGFIRLFTIHVEKFPLPKATPARKAQLIILADYLLWLYFNDRNKRLDQQNSRQSTTFSLSDPSNVK